MKQFSPEGFSILMLDYRGKEGYIHKTVKEIIYNFKIKGSPIVYNNEDAFMELMVSDPPINTIILNMDHLSMDAFEFVLMIRKSFEFQAFKDISIILVVEDTRAAEIFKAQHITIDGYLKKPVAAQDVKLVMTKILNKPPAGSPKKKVKNLKTM